MLFLWCSTEKMTNTLASSPSTSHPPLPLSRSVDNQRLSSEKKKKPQSLQFWIKKNRPRQNPSRFFAHNGTEKDTVGRRLAQNKVSGNVQDFFSYNTSVLGWIKVKTLLLMSAFRLDEANLVFSPNLGSQPGPVLALDKLNTCVEPTCPLRGPQQKT